MGLREIATRTLYGDVTERRGWTPPDLQREVARSRRYSGGTPGYDAAQAHGAVYACVDLLVRLVAWQMPAEVYRGSQHVTPPQIVANPHPDPHMSAQHWRAAAIEAAALRGYAAGLVVAYDGPWPRQIMPLHPDEVSWSRKAGRTTWRVGGREVSLWQDGGDLWVMPSPRVSPGQPVGRSVLGHAAASVRLGLGANKFGSDFFEAGGMPVAHIKVDDPTRSMTADEAEYVKERYLAATADRSPLVTTTDVDLTTIPVNAEESQFLQTVQANAAMVCMFFGIPPESIGASSGDSMTYANVEGRNLSLLTNTVGAWMRWFELLYSTLIPPPQMVQLDPEEMLRTSVPTLFSTAQVALSSGILSRDEARAMVGYSAGDGDGMSVQELTRALQQIYLSVGSVITADEAREILNRAGAGLALPGNVTGGA